MKQFILQNLHSIGTFLKVNSKAFIIALFGFIAPIKGLLLVVGLSIAADTIIGIYKAKKLKQKNTSRRISYSLSSKMLLYQSAVITFFILEKYLLGEFVLLFSSISFLLTKLLAVVLISVELKSVDESYKIITGVSLIDKAKNLLTRYKSIKKEIQDDNE